MLAGTHYIHSLLCPERGISKTMMGMNIDNVAKRFLEFLSVFTHIIEDSGNTYNVPTRKIESKQVSEIHPSMVCIKSISQDPGFARLA